MGVKVSASAHARSRYESLGEIKEVEMLDSMKSGVPEKDRNASVSAAEVMGRVVPHDQSSARSEPTTKAGTASCIGSDMSIVGKIECNGPAQVLGRIEGELRASDLGPNRRRVARLGSPDQRWRTGRGQHHCAGRYSLRPRQGHYPCRPRQAAERWCGRG